MLNYLKKNCVHKDTFLPLPIVLGFLHSFPNVRILLLNSISLSSVVRFPGVTFLCNFGLKQYVK